MRVLVIGAGVFGCNIAIELSKSKFNVDLIETDDDVMMRASRNNHNRLHLGYHYLRSQKTAKQSISGLLSFLFYYGESVLHSFPNYYTIAKDDSYTNAKEFVEFCESVGIDYDYEFPDEKILNRNLIEESFKVPEPVFDYNILKKIIIKRLLSQNINLNTRTTLIDLKKHNNTYTATTNQWKREYDVVINASYAHLNEINSMLGIQSQIIKYQKVSIPIFEFDHNPIGLTIMDGPFCSVMPLGKKKNKFLLYHVKNSVLDSCIGDGCPNSFNVDNNYLNNIYLKSQIYYPFLSYVKHISEYNTIRAVHDNDNDARVTELQDYNEFPNYFSVLSGKITTCVQVSLQIKQKLTNKKNIQII